MEKDVIEPKHLEKSINIRFNGSSERTAVEQRKKVPL